jgi:hypothetical protein
VEWFGLGWVGLVWPATLRSEVLWNHGLDPQSEIDPIAGKIREPKGREGHESLRVNY